MKRMRILLQRKDTGLYVRDTDSWTADSSEAMEFVSSAAALDYCVGHHIEGAQIVLKFDGEKYDIVLAVVPPQPGQDHRPRAGT